MNEKTPINAILKILSGKWKIAILYCLREKTRRFNELRQMMPEITQRVLTLQLRELEEDKIVLRTVYAQVPPKVEYSLTDLGQALNPILEQLEKWGACYIKKRKLMET